MLNDWGNTNVMLILKKKRKKKKKKKKATNVHRNVNSSTRTLQNCLKNTKPGGFVTLYQSDSYVYELYMSVYDY